MTEAASLLLKWNFERSVRRTPMKVKEIMHKGVEWVSQDPLVTTLAKKMQQHDVVADGKAISKQWMSLRIRFELPASLHPHDGRRRFVLDW